MQTGFFSTHSIIKEIYGHQLSGYLLIVIPTPDVYEKILLEKEGFYNEYEVQEINKKNPQLIVAEFLIKEAMEETLTRWMARIIAQQRGFTVTLNNYSGFPPDNIYLRVQDQQPFQKLAVALKELNHYIGSCACPPMHFSPRPHINIADELQEQAYFSVLKKYAHKTFHESFAVNELHLLKRRSEYDSYKTVNIFHLNPVEDTCIV